MKKIILILLAVISLSACWDPVSPNPNENEEENKNKINFARPEVGQASKYIFLKGWEYFKQNPQSYRHFPDTLSLEIVEFNSVEGWLIKESLSNPSDSLKANYPAIYLDSTIYYYMKIEGGSVIFHKPGEQFFYSHLLFYLDNNKELALNDFTEEKVEIDGWLTSYDYLEDYKQGFAENFSINGNHYSRANVIINNRPMQVDGPGFTAIYSAGYGIIRHYSVSWWTQEGMGWSLL